MARERETVQSRVNKQKLQSSKGSKQTEVVLWRDDGWKHSIISLSVEHTGNSYIQLMVKNTAIGPGI